MPEAAARLNFNPRSREGSDFKAELIVVFMVLFQSTLPRGERRVHSLHKLFHVLFQSTLPRGERRRVGRDRPLVQKISIHAPARGATGRSATASSAHSHFNPRSREGSDGV